jgi:hypothetical protein
MVREDFEHEFPGWTILEDDGIFHAVPQAEARAHCDSHACICGPELVDEDEDSSLWVHREIGEA